MLPSPASTEPSGNASSVNRAVMSGSQTKRPAFVRSAVRGDVPLIWRRATLRQPNTTYQSPAARKSESIQTNLSIPAATRGSCCRHQHNGSSGTMNAPPEMSNAAAPSSGSAMGWQVRLSLKLSSASLAWKMSIGGQSSSCAWRPPAAGRHVQLSPTASEGAPRVSKPAAQASPCSLGAARQSTASPAHLQHRCGHPSLNTVWRLP